MEGSSVQEKLATLRELLSSIDGCITSTEKRELQSKIDSLMELQCITVVVSLLGGDTVEFDMSSNDHIIDVKQNINQYDGTPIYRQALCQGGGDVLSNSEKLITIGISRPGASQVLVELSLLKMPGVPLTFEAPFDTNGMMYWIATQGKQQKYTNPIAAELVSASFCEFQGSRDSTGQSCHQRIGQASLIQHQNSGGIWTTNREGSWMAIDIGSERQLKVDYYCLRSAKDGNDKPRNWRLEASNDGHTWITLRSHVNDVSLMTRCYTVAAWAVESADVYRHFRVFSTGANSDNRYGVHLAGFELYGELFGQPEVVHMEAVAAPQDSSCLVPECMSRTCVFEAPFDTNGVLYWIATRGKQQPYRNPHCAGLVHASFSSVGGARDCTGRACSSLEGVGSLVQHQNSGGVWTAGGTGQWMAVDLGNCRLRINHYCLRSCKDENDKLRNWRLEGSNDGSTWTVLRSHVNDDSLMVRSYTVAAWAVETPDGVGSFRHFRVLSTGRNSDNRQHVTLAGIELYGELTVYAGME